MRAVFPTGRADVDAIICELVRNVKTELGDRVIGAYLVGSLAVGDFDIDSDIDFMIVVDGELDRGHVSALNSTHAALHVLDSAWAVHLEGSYMPRRLLNDSGAIGYHSHWFLDHGSSSLERSFHDNNWHVRWVLRESGIVVTGPDPQSLVDPIPPEELRGEMLLEMQSSRSEFESEMDQERMWWNSRFGQSFAVLTYCRILHTLETGAVHSKLAGVRRAMRTLDPRWSGLIQRAWWERVDVRYAVKVGQRAADADLRRTLDFIDYACLRAGLSPLR